MSGRGWSFLIASGLFYLFANQTQVGWVYVLSSLLLALVVVGWLLNRGALRHVTVTRSLQPKRERQHEDDPVTYTLTVNASVLQLQLREHCPLLMPNKADLRLYLPVVRGQMPFSLEVVLYQRGVQRFAPMIATTRVPFGFFERRKSLQAQGLETLIVYPVVKPLTAFDLFDRQPTAQQTIPKAGVGSEIIGVRAYRAGDSPRHIHWRGVARRGILLSREFAQETEEGVLLVLDRYAPYSLPTRDTPFEMAVKCAVSIGEYALRKRYPLYVAAWEQDLPHPAGALTWDALLQYTARVPSFATPHVHHLLARPTQQQMVVAVLAWCDPRITEPLVALVRRGVRVQVIVVQPDPSVLPDAPDAHIFADALLALDVPTLVVDQYDNWAEKISH